MSLERSRWPHDPHHFRTRPLVAPTAEVRTDPGAPEGLVTEEVVHRLTRPVPVAQARVIRVGGAGRVATWELRLVGVADPVCSGVRERPRRHIEQTHSYHYSFRPPRLLGSGGCVDARENRSATRRNQPPTARKSAPKTELPGAERLRVKGFDLMGGKEDRGLDRGGRPALEVRFICEPGLSTDDKARFPLAFAVNENARTRLNLTPSARTLLGILALSKDDLRARDLGQMLGSKRAYESARDKLIAEFALHDLSDILILPATAPNGRGPLAMDRTRCRVDINDLVRAIERAEHSDVADLTHGGRASIEFRFWGAYIGDRLSEENFLSESAAARRRHPERVEAGHDLRDVYLVALSDHCRTLPAWFPAGVDFAEIVQDVSVRPPAAASETDSQDGEGGPDALAERTETGSSGPRRLPWTTALEQLQRVLLIGDPGAGKSWAIKTRALTLAEGWSRHAAETALLPVLLVAPKLEERLGSAGNSLSSQDLATALAGSMPDEICVDASVVAAVADHLNQGLPTAVFVDGYDEVRADRPRLAQRLPEILALLDPRASTFTLTTRPASVPQQRFMRGVSTCTLQPFGEREQTQFVNAWFATDTDRARAVTRWVARRRLDILRTPLLVALFCAVSMNKSDSPPETEADLWLRAVQHLAAEGDRYEELLETSETVRLRISVLEEIASLFVRDSGLLDSVAIEQLDVLATHQAWLQLDSIRERATVVEDLASTGLLRKVSGQRNTELTFLHSAVRDYLLARHLTKTRTWPRHVHQLWAQPEWEPVFSYVGALSSEPDELILALETRFDDDPLNAARFAAGRIIASAGAAITRDRRDRVRDELLVLLASHDDIDRSRSAGILALLRDSETPALVRALLSPAIPSRVVVAALQTIAGDPSSESIAALTDCARAAEYTLDERQAAVEALADTGATEAVAALAALVADNSVDALVRAAAAFAGLRLFNQDGPARDLLMSIDDDSKGARWLLAERIAAHAGAFDDFVGGLLLDADAPVDPYFRALLVEDVSDYGDDIARAIPANPAHDLAAAAAERARDWARSEPLAVTVARFILDQARSVELRWRVAVTAVRNDINTAAEIWNGVASQTPRDQVEVAEFLASELAALPD